MRLPKPNAKKTPANAGVATSRVPFCDLRCACADFAKATALDGSCRPCGVKNLDGT